MLYPTPLKIASFYWWNGGITQNDASWFIPLQQEFKKNGYLLDIHKKHPIEMADLVIFAHPNIPIHTPKTNQIYIFALESPLSLPQPLPPEIIRQAKKIFTWRHNLVDNQKTFYMPCGLLLRRTLPPNPSAQTTLVTQVASNYPQKEYHNRRDAVIWFLQNHPSDLTFYGKKWDTLLPTLSLAEQTAFSRQYRGYTPDKAAVLNKARFTLAYENVPHLDYVSEKIYDVMLAGSVPVYLGAPNITDYIPKECFVNKRDFETYDKLYAFLKNMPQSEYQKYLDCAKTFLTGPTAEKLTGPLFAKTIANEIFK